MNPEKHQLHRRTRTDADGAAKTDSTVGSERETIKESRSVRTSLFLYQTQCRHGQNREKHEREIERGREREREREN